MTKQSLRRRRPAAFSLGIVALTALAAGIGVYFYPELIRTIHMHRM